MKKLVASVGLVALGVSGVQTLSAQSLASPDPSKPWSVQATLRGFYDDNFNTISKDIVLPSGYSESSFGYEIAPSAKLNLNLEQTSIALGYNFSYKQYEESSPFFADKNRMSHEFTAALEHAFTPRARLSLRDGFVIGQEPDLLRSGSTFNTFQSIPGDNIRNHGVINLGLDITRTFGLEVGYGNNLFDYDDEFDGDVLTADEVAAYVPSLSALLDRVEHTFHVDGRLTLTPSTVGVLGYQYGQTDYTGDDALGYVTAIDLTAPNGIRILDIDPEVRNNRSYYVYVGADHTFRSDLTGNVRVGGRYTDYYNDGDDGISPFVNASLRWSYADNGYVEGGVEYDRTAADLFGMNDGDIVRDQEAGTIFGSIRHQLMPKLYGSVTGQFQNSTYNGGPFDGDSEQFYLAGLHLEYQFHRHLSAHVGYNYDLLETKIDGRGFDRNRVYLGVTAAY